MIGGQGTKASEKSEDLVLEQRSWIKDEDTDTFQEIQRTVRWNPGQTAIIICDMWDDHTCKGAAERWRQL